MLPTPSTSHVSFDRVYEPAEDSFLILDTLSSPGEKSFLAHRFRSSPEEHVQHPPLLVLEIGTGSGVVLAFLNANARIIFGRSDILTVGTDVNCFACDAARETVRASEQQTRLHVSRTNQLSHSHGYFLDTLNADLANSFRSGCVDLVVFNPPYVPAELPDFSKHEVFNSLNPNTTAATFERDSYLLELSYAGGIDGMEVTDKFLQDLPRMLHPSRGVAYLLLCAQNQPQRVHQRVGSWGPEWSCEMVGSSGRQAGWERLQVLRIWRTPST